ncbi:MAG: hypothetical protein MJ252_04815 [archaeon]|nr:hypothetical protein [archaeon]
MEGGTVPSNLSLFLILLICIALDVIDIIELSRLKDSWRRAINDIDPITFNNCSKNELILKSAFSSFSFLAAFSATTVICLLLFIPELFLKQFLKGFVYMNYLIFGLYMLGFTLYFILYWDQYAYVCDANIPGVRFISMVNCFSIFGCLILAVIVTFGYTIYDTVNIYSNSINKNENSVELLRKAFWWAVFKGRNSAVPRANNNNHNNHINNNNPNILVENNAPHQPENLIDDNNDNENQRLI